VEPARGPTLAPMGLRFGGGSAVRQFSSGPPREPTRSEQRAAARVGRLKETGESRRYNVYCKNDVANDVSPRREERRCSVA